MANLPTAYTSQRFGRRSLDFYAAAGEVVGSDPRARADERRLQDLDGARHTIRLMEPGFKLEPGYQASVIRLQAGPSRRSRAVAVVNHGEGTWSRTHPGASALLSRSGIARNVNWWLTVVMFALAALLCVWPYFYDFIAVLAPNFVTPIPSWNVFELAAANLPQLASFDVSAMMAPIVSLVGQQNQTLAGFVPAALFTLVVLIGSAIVFAARSWRLLWAPLLVGGIGVLALSAGGVDGAIIPALSGLGMAAMVFMIGGAINRNLDAIRLEQRIALLADHLISHPPAETVSQLAAAATEDDVISDADLAEDAQLKEQVEDVEAEGDAVSEIDAPDAGSESDPESDGDTPVADAELAEDEAVDEADDSETVATAPEAQDVDESQDGDQADELDETNEDAASLEADDFVEDAPETDLQTRDETGSQTSDDTVVSSDDDAENERLKSDPRYAARAIVLPPPPPMASNEEAEGEAEIADTETVAPTDNSASETEASDSALGETPSDEGTPRDAQTLKPDAPLSDHVTPIFKSEDQDEKA